VSGKPPVAPKNVKERKVGQVYTTPQGIYWWTGEGWAREMPK